MKSIFLILVLSSLLFSMQKQIIVGSYLHKKYAMKDFAKLNNYVIQDKKLLDLVKKNSVNLKLKMIGQYNVLSLLPYTNYVQLLRTLKELEKYYDDAYVLDLHTQTPPQIKQKDEPIDYEVIEQEAVKETIHPTKIKTVMPKTLTVQETVPEKTPTAIEPTKSENQQIKNGGHTFEIILIILVLLGGGFIFYITSKWRKKAI